MLLACSDDTTLTELVVVVDTNLDASREFDAIDLGVQGPSGMLYPVSTAIGAEGSPTLPLYTFLEPAGDSLGPVEITASARLGDADVVVQRRVRTSFLRGESRTVYIYLDRDCRTVACGDDMTCTDGTCGSIDVHPSSLPPWTGSLDKPDAASDGGTDSGTADSCTPATEACNGADDDCDGTTDEGFDLMRDGSNCGACGTTCEDEARSSARCDRGVCTLTCDPGFDDCDADYATGCESDLSAPANCGDCATTCGPSAALCDSRRGCVTGCRRPATLCGVACVNTNTDVSHCDGCGTVCPDQPRSTSVCARGACDISCDTGFDDCDGDAANGCEQQLNTVGHCGACGAACTVANGTEDCASGSCQIGACAPGFANCDSRVDNGCEAPARTLYEDSDGDSFGNPLVTMTAGCTTPAGWVSDDTDCDDTRASIRPGGMEICNGRDDDCDTGLDEGLMGCAERCPTAMVVDDSITFSGLTTCSSNDNGDAQCDGGRSNPDHVYRLELTAMTSVRMEVTGNSHLTIWVETTCGSGASTLMCMDEFSSQTMDLPAGTYYVHLEATRFPCSVPYNLEFTYL